MVQPISYIKQSGEIIIVDLRQKKKKKLLQGGGAHMKLMHTHTGGVASNLNHIV